MTHEDSKKWAAEIAALQAGKPIQTRLVNSEGQGGMWFDDRNPSFTNPYVEHRVKPELREWWINIFSDGYEKIHKSEKEADLNAASFGGLIPRRIACIHVREVVKDL